MSALRQAPLHRKSWWMKLLPAFKERYEVVVEEISVAQERVQFKLPLSLRSPA